MDETFLYLVAKDILGRLNGDLGNCALIFPNKRPAIYLESEFEKQGYTGKYPLIYSIENFIDENAGSKSVNAIDQILMLFRLYLKHYPESDFDTFYGWGNMMLGDFDEIDRYMADPVALFKNLSAVKDLEKYFLQDESMPFEMLPELQPEDEQYLKKRFLENWEVYEKIYFDFKKELLAKNLAYSGMNFRKVAEDLKSGLLNPDAEKYIFVGFNAISKSEEYIIQQLIDLDRALIYWDGDHYFVDNEREKSGYFIRKSMQGLRGYNAQLFSNQLLEGSKNIHIIGAPLKVGLSKVLGVELKKNLIENKAGSSCIVLADENLAEPVLYALPENIGSYDLGSGSPLKYSSEATFFLNLTNLINNFRPESRSFYHKDVVAVLSHPLIRSQGDTGVALFLNKIKDEQLIYISISEIDLEVSKLEDTGSRLLKLYFKEIKSTEEVNDYFHAVYINIKDLSRSGMAQTDPYETILEEMSGLVRSYKNLLTKKMYLRLFKESTNKYRVDIQTQNINSLQIMGMLETRSLDFDTVFMLPVNEGVIPDVKYNRSYIPFDIRRNFGLPLQDEQESIYAYNFYRLLQRAKNIYLLFDSESGSGGEEESRYIRQIEYYLPKSNPGIRIHRRFYGFPLKGNPAKEIIIPKDWHFYDTIRTKNESGLSPTFISSYFICSLQFYFKNILKIPENEAIVEDLEAKHFGTLYHNLMEMVYADLKGEQVNEKTLSIKKAGLSVAIDQVLSKIHGGQKHNIVQKNNILIETVKILAERTLDADIINAPFKLIDTEVSSAHQIAYSNDGFDNINLKGIIDRIDEKDGITRIVDYKTGRVKLNYFNYNDPEESLHKDNKEAFQTLFYGMLYLEKNQGERLKLSVLPLREVIKGYININEKDGIFTIEESKIFENKLKTIIHTILDPDVPINQTEDLSMCRHCSYKNICMR